MDMCMVDYKVPNNMWKKYFCIKVHSTLYISLTFPSLNLLIGTNKELKQSLGKPRFSIISRTYGTRTKDIFFYNFWSFWNNSQDSGF